MDPTCAPLPWRGFFCDLPRAVQPSVSPPVDWAGLLVTFVEWVCVGKHKWPASLRALCNRLC